MVSNDIDSTGWTKPPNSYTDYVEGQLVKVVLNDKAHRIGVVRLSDGDEDLRVQMKGRELPIPYQGYSVDITAVEELTEKGLVPMYPFVDVPSWAKKFRPPVSDRDGERLHIAIIELLRTKRDEIISSALLEKQIKAPGESVTSALQDLIIWGEVEFIWDQGIAGRVQLKESIDDREPLPERVADSVWVVQRGVKFQDHHSTCTFTNEETAIRHVEQFTGSTRLEKIPYLNAVWTIVGDKRPSVTRPPVVRCEPVYESRPSRE